MRHIAANRPVRRRRAYLLACCVMSSLVLLVAGAAWGAASYANDALGRIFAGTAGGTSGPLNLLLAGVDLRSGLTPQQQRALHVGHDVSSNSDTLMLIHIAADRSSVTVVSLPRDSWVDIPGHGMNKINAAFGIGGPQLTVRQGHRRARRGEHLPAAGGGGPLQRAPPGRRSPPREWRHRAEIRA
jgi:anionic cell wall polymer biosynthesis LytR-Cps2A-Psr (LCP) family protein